MKRALMIFLISVIFTYCDTYHLQPYEFATQLELLKVNKVRILAFGSFGAGKGLNLHDKNDYQTTIGKIYCYDKNNKGDSVYAREDDYRFTFKNGDKKRGLIKYLIVRNNYFISVYDTNLTVSRCKSCKISVDSVAKVEIIH